MLPKRLEELLAAFAAGQDPGERSDRAAPAGAHAGAARSPDAASAPDSLARPPCPALTNSLSGCEVSVAVGRFKGHLAVAVAVVTASVAAPSVLSLAGESWRDRVSWSDAKHGWALADDVPGNACRAPSVLCGTEDGGRTWHPVFRSTEWSGSRFVRTTARTGIHHIRLPSADVLHPYWTSDAGRRWYRTTLSRIRGDDGIARFEISGHGRFLYWHMGGRVLFRVRPWPPVPTPTCRGTWRLDLTRASRPTPGARWGRICVGAAADAGMRTAVAVRLRTDRLGELEPILHGIVSLLEPVRKERPTLLFLRDGRMRRVRLPKARLGRDAVSLSGYRIRASRPRIVVVATAFGPSDDERLGAEPVGCVVWRSADGGRTWRSSYVGDLEADVCD